MGYATTITQRLAKDILPTRLAEGHKYTFGSVLVIGGSSKMPGAAALVSEATLSAGAGAVTLAAPESVLQRNGLVLPEVMRLPLPESKEGTLDRASFKVLAAEDLSRFDVFAAGPGMGQTQAAQELFDALMPMLLETGKPIVLDADALNALSRSPVKLSDRVIITPHPGEAEQLLGGEAGNPEETARALRDKYGATTVLKSHATLIAGNDGKLWQNTTGNSGLATAGSGDVLTGVIAALLAQGCQPLAAAQLGVYLHGLAGDLASSEYTEYGVRAGLVSQFLAPAIKQLI